MKANPKHLIWPVLMLLLAVLACSPYQYTTISNEQIYTAAAQTVLAQTTLSAGQTAIAQLTRIAQGGPGGVPSATSQGAAPSATLGLPTVTSNLPSPILPSLTPLPSQTPLPTLTPLPSQTLVPPTPKPTRTPTPIPCNWALFIRDVTVPDGTIFPADAEFTKTWRLKNIGDCTWNSKYALVYVSGTRMYVEKTVPLPGVVRPGESIDISVDMVAPASSGRYKTYWMLRDSYGYTFGIGGNAEVAFWVDIQVAVPSGSYAYDFAANICSAAWSNSKGALPCPGNETSSLGSVILLDAPSLETGRHENELTLWTRPEQINGGWIKGIYPKYKVQTGDRFMAEIGCLSGSAKCDVNFSVSYKVQGGGTHSLGNWREVYDKLATRVELDLSGLVGQTVQFILTVTANKAPGDADAYWLAPSIRRTLLLPPPPTKTPTPTAVVLGPTPTYDPNWETIPAVQAAKSLLAGLLNVFPNRLESISVVSTWWQDTCLGLPQPGQICAPAAIPGYKIVLEYESRRFEVHTDQEGIVIYWFEL
jgi:hypothetical protein